MTGCRIGRACVLLCLATRLLEFIQYLRQQQGELFKPGMVAMLESVEIVLSEPELRTVDTWNGAERKALERLRETATQMCGDRDVGAAARTLLARITLAT
jgi:hypothetical protein